MFSVSESSKSTILLLLEIAIVTGGLGVVLLRKIVYSALLLGFVFICVALNSSLNLCRSCKCSNLIWDHVN